MSRSVYIAGVGMTPFVKPFGSENEADSYVTLGRQAVHMALEETGLDYEQIQQAYAGYVYGDSTAGQKVLYGVGRSGIPVFNVNNNCSTGSSALYLARQAVASGAVDCALAVGFEQMRPGAIDVIFEDRPSPFEDFDDLCDELVPDVDLPLALRYFGGAGLAHMQKYGSTLADYASIRAKASRHAKRNPNALLRNEITTEEVLQSPELWPGVMTRLMACPPTCGGAAAIIVSEQFAKRHGCSTDVQILAQRMTTDTDTSFDSKDMMALVGYGMSQTCADAVYAESGVGPDSLDLVEMHDCFAHNELISYEALGLCDQGEASRFIADADNTYGGAVVTNPSGGLLSKGHPLGATGLAQCYEITQQLRGQAGPRQVEGAKFGLQHNLGLGGACVVTLYGASA